MSVLFKHVLALLLAMPLAVTATVAEVEPNNSLATAQVLTGGGNGMLGVAGERSFADPSDDFFAFYVARGGLVSIASTSPDGFADSIMGLFDPSGMLVASNDDGGAGFMSDIDYVVPDSMTGIYKLGFSGFNPLLLACGGAVTECYDTDGDFVFDTFVAGGGAGGSAGWTYEITLRGSVLISEPPAPLLAATALLLLAAPMRRRARRQQVS